MVAADPEVVRIQFFEQQFRRQVAERDFALNPFEQAALPYVRGRVLDLGCGLGNLCVAAARRGAQGVAGDASGETLDRIGRFDLIVVTATLEQRTKTAAEQLLARLRERHGTRILAVVPLIQRPGHASRWEANELLAFGMTSLGVAHQSDGDYQVYLFDLFDYKTVPDWFNARFWAHPERWDKESW